MTYRARRDGARGGRHALAGLALCTVACGQLGVVGVTSSNASERDATGGLPDAAVHADAVAPVAATLIDHCLPVNAANLDPAATRQLIDGTGDATSMRFLYPYDGTVYPQGIPAPVLMWDGPAPDAVYVRLHSATFDYRGCLKPSGPNRLELPSGVWDVAAASTSGAAEPFTLELKSLSGGAISGPISERLVIANGALKGSVYYMTTASEWSVSGIKRIREGRPAEPFLSSINCTGCHSASANGTRFLAYSGGFGSSFTLSASSPVTPLVAPTPGAEFPAIYPDGSVYVASAHPTGGGGPRSYGGSVADAGLYDTATGTLIPDSGIPAKAVMPAFSPDGSRLAFTDFGASPGHTLALMRFSAATRTASEYRSLYSSAALFAGWPAFLPDGQAVIFTQGDGADFSGQGVGLHPLGPRGPSTDLFIVDVASGAPRLLSQAMGFRSEPALDAETYLPGGAADLHQSYYPSVSPAASGGYAWVFFDSTRSYGNQGARRAIWGTAISLSADGTIRTDPSHPAFYLPGQNPVTPNFRGVAVLDPVSTTD